MRQSPVTQALRLVRRDHPDDLPLIAGIRDLLQVERDEFAEAWLRGNTLGWEQETDWPEHGYRDYDMAFGPNAPKRREPMAPERVQALVQTLIAALYIPCEGPRLRKVDTARLEHFGIDGAEPVNWGSLRCLEVDEADGFFEVTVEEAAPDSCPTLCGYIERYAAEAGWKVRVATEW